MNIIEVQDLTKFFFSEFKRIPIKILDDVSFVVEKGSTFGLLGPNGAGKTTTMKIILGLLKPSSGDVSILGKSVANKEIRSKIGYMTEAPYFYTYLSGYEFLHFCADLLEMNRKTKNEKIDELIEMMGMTGRIYERLGKYSKGMMQRIGLAQALLNDPEIILLDEPMSGLDPLGRKDVREIIVKLKQQNKTIFFNSHIISDVEILCDTVGIMKNGTLIACDKVSNIIYEDQYTNLEEFFLEKIKDHHSDALIDTSIVKTQS